MDDATAPRRRLGWRGTLLIAVVAFVAGLIVTGVGLKYYQRWSAPTGEAQPARQQAGENFSPTAPLDASGRTADFDALAAREALLGARIGQLETRVATIGESAQAAAGNATRAEGLLVAFAARRALDRGLGLGYLEGQLRARFGATQPQAVATVVAAARQPVTLEDLREGIERIGPELATGNTTDGWWASLRRELSDLIVVRRAGDPSPRPTDRLSRARRMLDGGQVEAALAEIARLPGAASGDRWIEAARRYIGARQALDTLESTSLSLQAPALAAPLAVPGAAAPTGLTAPARPAGDPVTGAPAG